ncbi:MAG: glycosyltransferase family 2 protein [Candidatus Aminicenantes bacterium]|jgi:hyaluronan synthase|nr:glycosyltransferase family 2 protein [Candidatus Aminicenantes bacterium]
MNKTRRSKKRLWINTTLSLASLVLILVAIQGLNIISNWREIIVSSSLLKILSYPLLICFGVLILGMTFRGSLWLKYKPDTWKNSDPVELPFISVVMPAFNEEKDVGKAVEAIMSSDYPENKLELICVDDGSTDQTWEILNELRRKYSGNLKIVSLKRNRGKRKALYQGIKKARGEIIVTTDADSQIQRRALRNLILPLLRDNRVGAVAGKVAVLNERRNLITRMLTAQYALAFDFGRAYQSVYGGVLCCPGALSAFRREAIDRVIRAWVKQKFLKVACNHGEDRALTNLVLKKGYLVKYQANAVVYTRVPEKIRQVNRMYLRWTRGSIRESWLFARYLLMPRKKKYYLLPAVDFFFQLMLHPLHLMVIALLIYSFLMKPDFIFPQLIFLLILAFALSLNNWKIMKSFKFIYTIPQALFTFFFQWWLVPYAVITIKDQNWLTK